MTLAALGAVGLAGVLAGVALLAVGAAGRPNLYVPAHAGGWPAWLTGPLHSLGMGLSEGRFQALTLLMAVGYLIVLFAARALSLRAIAITIVAAHVLLMLAPPLISLDVFGYLDYARLGILHGLDPYSHFPAQASGDAIYRFVGWHHQHSPYGPLFTLLSYALVPLGVGGGIWALKLLAAAASLGAVWLLARAAGRMGMSRRTAAVFVGLNPVLLELAVGGDHNDTLVLLAVSGALALTAATPQTVVAAGSGRLKGAMVALATAVGLKVSAGLVLPFVLASPAPAGTLLRRRERLNLFAVAVAALALIAVVGLIAFGSHLAGFLEAVSSQQNMIEPRSIPAETGRLLGLHGLHNVPTWWRDAYLALFVAVTCVTLWWTARGGDWRTGAGWATLTLVVCTAWLLPWYAIWPLPLAALSRNRALRVATLVFCAYALACHLPAAQSLLNAPHHTAHVRRATG